MHPIDAELCAAPALPGPLGVTSDGYARACAGAGIKGGHAGAIERYRRFYREGVLEQPGLSVAPLRVGRVIESDSPEGAVRKFTMPLGPARAGVYDKADPAAGAPETESVIIPMIGKRRIRTHTLCVSSQVGCAMGCAFCQTAQMGLLRNLTAEEIVAQWFAARWLVGNDQQEEESRRGGEEERLARSVSPPLLHSSSPALGSGCPSIRNVVFMGMGEPMDNLGEVVSAIAILTDRNGPNLPMSKVTISTVGRVDGIARLAEQVRRPGWHRLNLAVSLNAPSDEVRSQIMPINRRFSMSDLRAALEAWPIYGAAKLCLEYVLIPGVNDRPEHAVQLGDYVLGRGAHAGRPPLPGLVNLIPYNPRASSPWPAPEEAGVDRFLAQLTGAGVYAKRRRTKGRDQMAACGQLGNLELRRKPRALVTLDTSTIRSYS